MSTTRRLAALMFTDMVGYSAMAYQDEYLAIELVADQRAVVREFIAKHNGREHQTTGDGFFIEFASAFDAVHCAIAIQSALRDRSRHVPEKRQINLRIGIHLGDILAKDIDLYGNGVNLAARIEPLAPVGGICVTRQVYDQVAGKLPGYELEGQGTRNLKNIPGGAEIYKIIMPWEKQPGKVSAGWRGRLQSPLAINVAMMLSLFLVSAAILLSIGYTGLRPMFNGEFAAGREPASQMQMVESTDLSEGWTYQTADANRAPKPNAWKPFLDAKNTWAYGEEIRGHYFMRKTFNITQIPRQPAIVLGLVSDSHRVYLNGNFVGGSDQYGDLAFFSFDQKLLRTDRENEILIDAETRPTLNPGLIILPEVGAFAGEFSQVREAVMRNQVRFHLLKNISFSFSIIMFLTCLGYALFVNLSPTYFYSALILLLGAIHLAYYNPWVEAAFDYTYVRFLKAFGLGLAPFVLLSAFLRLRQRFRWEFINNMVTIGAGLLIGIVLLALPQSTVTFTYSYNTALALSGIYSTLWIAIGLGLSIWRARRKTWSQVAFEMIHTAFEFEGVFVISAIVGVSSILAALKFEMASAIIPPAVRTVMVDLSLVQSFFFSVYLLVVGTIEHARKGRVVNGKRQRDDFMLGLIHLMANSEDPYQTITQIQDRVCQHLSALRSTLYVFENTESGQALEASYATGEASGNFTIKRSISPTEGIIGYAFQNRTPLLIEDIKNDPRFFGPDAKYPIAGHKSYRSGSCMIFPLSSGPRLVGVLTFADKSDHSAFTPRDFSVVLEVGASLALLLDNRQMQQELFKLNAAS